MRVQSGRMEPLGAREDPTEDAGIELGFEDRKEGKNRVAMQNSPLLVSACPFLSLHPTPPSHLHAEERTGLDHGAIITKTFQLLG